MRYLLIILRVSPYFGPDGKRRGYDIDNVELLISTKYEEASYKEEKYDDDVVDDSAEADEEKKKAIVSALEAFQEGAC